MKNVAVIMFGARENFLTHQIGCEGKSMIEIMRLLSVYFAPVSSSITKFTADIIVNDVKIGALVAFPSEKTPFDRVQPIITEVASSISALLNDRYREAISPDTDLHLAQLTFLFLSMIRSPLRKVVSVRSQLASSFDFLHQIIESFATSSTAFRSSMPSNEEMLSYFDLFNQEIDIFRQETRAFHFVVDAALRSLHHHVVSYEEEEVFGACHHHSSNSDLEKVLSDSLETITKQSTILTRHSSTNQNLEEEDEDDIAIIDDNDEDSEGMCNEEDINLIPVEDAQNVDIKEKRAIYYPKTPGCTPRTWPYHNHSGEQSHNHSSHNIKSQYNLSRKCIFPEDSNNVDSLSSEVTGLPPLSPGKRRLSVMHSVPSLPLPPPDTDGGDEGEEGVHTSSLKSIRTPVASCSFSYSFTSSPMSRTETLPESYTQPTPMARGETITLMHNSNLSHNDVFHGVLNSHSASDINLDRSAVVVACEPSASCTSPLSLTLTNPATTSSDVVAFHPHHHYHYQHMDEVNHNRSGHNINVTKTIVDKNNHSYHNMRTSFVDNSAKKCSDEEEDDDDDEESEESVTVAVSYDWDNVAHDRPQDMVNIAEEIRNTFASLAVLDT